MKFPLSRGRQILSGSAEHRSLSPLRLSLIVLVGQVATYVATFLAVRPGTSFFGVFTVGHDYHDYFYRAAGDWLTTGSPHRHLFVAPPPSVMPAALLHGFSEPTSHAIYSVITVCLMAFGLWRFSGALGLRQAARSGLLACSATFLPMWLLVCGGNTDGLMLGGLLLGYSLRSGAGRALFLAGTIVVKVYSAVLLVVALRKREWRLVGLTAAFSVLFLLPFWRLWPEALHVLLSRTGYEQVMYNISPAQLFYLVLHRWGALAWQLPYATCWLGALAYTLRRNVDRNNAETLGTYAPFMITAPLLVLAYGGVMALPTFALMLRVSQDRPLRRREWLAIAGFLLLDFHPEFAVAYGSYTFAAFHNAKLAASVAGAVGTTLLVVATVWRARTGAQPILSTAAVNR